MVRLKSRVVVLSLGVSRRRPTPSSGLGILALGANRPMQKALWPDQGDAPWTAEGLPPLFFRVDRPVARDQAPSSNNVE